MAGPLKRPEWMDRIDSPEKYPHITNQDGSISTHRMAAEVDEMGNWLVFPTIIQEPNGELIQFQDSQNAMDYATRTGNYKLFNNKEEALGYSKGGYKTESFVKYYNELMNKK